jgi:hypothetical protein
MKPGINICTEEIVKKYIEDQKDMDIIAHYLESFGFKTEILTLASDDGTNVVKNFIAKYGKMCNRRGQTLRPSHNEIFLAGTRKNAAQDRSVPDGHEDPSLGSDEVDCTKNPLCNGLLKKQTLCRIINAQSTMLFKILRLTMVLV